MDLKNWKVLKCNDCGKTQYFYGDFNDDFTFEEFELEKTVLGNGDVTVTQGCSSCGIGTMCEVNFEDWTKHIYADILSSFLEDNNKHKLTNIGYSVIHFMEDAGVPEIYQTKTLQNMLKHYAKYGTLD